MIPGSKSELHNNVTASRLKSNISDLESLESEGPMDSNASPRSNFGTIDKKNKSNFLTIGHENSEPLGRKDKNGFEIKPRFSRS
jgi:hypothetical protein